MEEMATNEMLQTLKPGLRPFIVGRSTFAGIVSILEAGTGCTRLIKRRGGNRLTGSATITRHGECFQSAQCAGESSMFNNQIRAYMKRAIQGVLQFNLFAIVSMPHVIPFEDA